MVSLRFCPDCRTEHMGAPCGLSYAQRLRSVSVPTDWMPCKQDSRSKGHGRPYYDDEGLKDLFGYDRKERKEMLMDETKGMGVLDSDDPKHVDVVLGKEED